MKLINIKIKNFRCFHGESSISFAGDIDKKITVIHAENHSGKTNFVDAFRWCFYGKIVGEQPEKIVNFLAISEAKDNDLVFASVSVQFEWEGQRYTFKREKHVRKISSNEYIDQTNDFKAFFIGANGITTNLDNPTVSINRILPEGMDQYFFLAGENVQELGEEGSEGKIKEAIKILMGLTIIDRSIKDLKSGVKKRLTEDLRNVAQHDLKKIIDEKTKYEDEKKRLEGEQIQYNSNIENSKLIKARIEDKLRENERTQDLQKKKDSLNNDLAVIQERIKTEKEVIIDKISREGFIGFVGNLSKEVKIFVEDKRQKGVIPSNIRYGLIQDLLDKEECICKRPLKTGSKEYDVVHALQTPESKPECENAFNAVGLAAASLLEANSRLPFEFKEFRRSLKDNNEKAISLQAQLEEIETKFKSVNYEEVQDLVKQVEKIQLEIEGYITKIGENNIRINDLNTKITDLQNTLKTVEQGNQQYQSRFQRLQYCESVIIFLGELYNSLVDRDRIKLGSQINEIFKTIISGRENAHIELNKDFELKVLVRYPDGVVQYLPRSGSQAQLTCLSFILSVIKIARENLQDVKNPFKRGGEYPLVLDSPFGVLSNSYRKAVAHHLPLFINQLVVLVAPQQWDQEMENEMKASIGKRYVFKRFAAERTQPINQLINGKHFDLVQYADGRVRTEIEEVI